MSDEIDLKACEVHGSPDIADWPITTTIASVDVNHRGVIVAAPKLDGPNPWPDLTPPTWDGPLQYTLWIGVERDGRWHVAAALSFWRGRGTHNDDAGGDVFQPDQIGKNWLYDSRYGSMRYAQPIPGERVAFFIAAGSQRFDPGVIETVRERSNVVTVVWPTQPQTFTFDAPVPTPTPEPVPTPPAPIPEPAPPFDPSPLLAQIAALQFRVAALESTPLPDYLGTVSYPFFGSRTIRSKPEGK